MRSESYLSLIMIFFLFGSSYLSAQNLDVDGSAKISEMEIDNTADNLVVQKEDGTLARRQLSSMPSPPELSDTTRTFANDLEFAKLICNCSTVPPFLVESALDAGYTERQLYEGGVDLESLIYGGVVIDSLLAFGETLESLLANTSFTPMDLYDRGVAVMDMYGVTYEAGLIFYIDTLDVYPEFEGFVAAPNNQGSNIAWGCSGVLIPGADGSTIGTGEQNTIDILDECMSPGIAAILCGGLDFQGYDDWFLPSTDELNLMYENLRLLGFGSFIIGWYHTSTEWSSVAARLIHFGSGSVSSGSKSSGYFVRAARAF